MSAWMMMWLGQPWIERAGWTLVHFLWQGLVIAGALRLACLFIRASASRRYVAGCAALALMAVAPVLTFLLLDVRAEAGAPVLAKPADVITTGAVPIANTPRLRGDAISRGDIGRASPAVEVAGTAGPMRDLWGRIVESVRPALPWMVVVWLMGVLTLLARHALGWAQVQRLKGQGTPPLDERLMRMLGELAGRLHIARTVRLLELALIEVPAVVGWLRPVILLPVAALSGLTVEQVRAILAHELAHVRRHDYLVNLVQTLVETALFFHPGVWWVSAQIRQEREHCCDDVAAGVCGDRVSYARALLRVEELRDAQAVAQLALAATGGNLMKRIRRITNVGPARGVDVRRSVSAGMAVAVAVVCVGLLWTMSVRISPAAAQPMSDHRNGTRSATSAPADANLAGQPHVVQSVPADGQLDVDPNLNELRITFDRPMDTRGGWSFVGGDFAPKSAGTPRWIDDRTIVRPIELEAGKGYWTSINYGRFNNFRAKDGTPAVPHPISFATKPNTFSIPKVVQTSPARGAKDVDPGTTKIRVVFDQAMDQQAGWTFAQRSAETFPQTTGRPTWVDDRTIELPVKMQAGRSYWISINSPRIQNFHGTNRLAAEAYVLEFVTGGEGAGALGTEVAGQRQTVMIGTKVNRAIADFPAGVDLSSPDSALAAYHRASAKMDARGVIDLSWVHMEPDDLTAFWSRDARDIAVYNQAQLDAEVLMTLTYGDVAGVISRLKFPAGVGRDPYSLRYFGRINGQWKNLGEDRLSSAEAAEATFGRKKDNIVRQLAQLRPEVALRNPLPAVRVIIGPGGKLTLDGEAVTLEQLPQRLQRVPNREQTVLEYAVSSEDLTVGELYRVTRVLMNASQRLGFRYLSDTGIKSEPPSARGDQDVAR